MTHFDNQLSDSDHFVSIFFVRSLHFINYLQLCISGFIVGIEVGTRNPKNDAIAWVSVLF